MGMERAVKPRKILRRGDDSPENFLRKILQVKPYMGEFLQMILYYYSTTAFQNAREKAELGLSE